MTGGANLAKHEFGIMLDTPQKGKRYDEYEPDKYNCISIDDEYIECVDANLTDIDFYWHSLDVKGKGIAYCGITLIPPTSIKLFINAVKDRAGLSELAKLAEKAYSENKWMIHFGL